MANSERDNKNGLGSDEIKEIKPTTLLCSSRMGLALLGFFAFVQLYALRINMSVAMVCMVNQTALDTEELIETSANLTSHNYSSGEEECGEWSLNADEEGTLGQAGEFVWSKSLQGLILSAFFWGYLFTQIPGGYLAERFGGKRVMGYTQMVVALATLLSPVAARTSPYFLIALRVVKGLGQGVVWPCMVAMWAHWAPPLERTKLVGFAFAGAQIGNVVTLPAAALLCDYGFDGGWPSVFYVFGTLSFIWCIIWMIVVADSPAQHPRISAHEKLYIESSLQDQMEALKRRREGSPTPWRAIFTSLPVWAIIMAQTCSDWQTYTLLTQLPSFMKEVLKFDIKSNGLFSAIPYIAFWLFINITGWTVDYLREKKYLTTTQARKLCQVLSSSISVAFLIGTGYVHCSETTLAVVLLTIAVAFMGLQYGSYTANGVDIAPRYAGVLFGIANTASTVSGILAPYAVGLITTDRTPEQWMWVFYVTGGICMFGAIFYAIFASGELQDWAKEEVDENVPRVGDQEMKLLNSKGDKEV